MNDKLNDPGVIGYRSPMDLYAAFIGGNSPTALLHNAGKVMSKISPKPQQPTPAEAVGMMLFGYIFDVMETLMQDHQDWLADLHQEITDKAESASATALLAADGQPMKPN